MKTTARSRILPRAKTPSKSRLMTKFSLMIITLLALLASHSGLAAAGDLDPAFGQGGKVSTDLGQSNDLAYNMALQPDGKIIAVGIRFVGNDAVTGDFAVVRYNSDGSLDQTFGNGGFVVTDFGLTETALAVAIQADGKIVVAGGTYPTFPFLGLFAVARYNSDGSLDNTFGGGGLVRTGFGSEGASASAIVIQSDGKIIAAGTKYIVFSNEEQSDTDFALARYNSDGSLDSTFGGGGLVATDFNQNVDQALEILLQPDGNIVAAGTASSMTTSYDFGFARYLSNGTLDTTFGRGGTAEFDLGGGTIDLARSAVLQPDGKIVAAGTIFQSDGFHENFAVLRLQPNGRPDRRFAQNGVAQIDFGSFFQSAYGVALQADGKIVTAGYADTEGSDSDFLLARLNRNGTLDTSFGAGGKVRTSFGDLNGGAKAVVVQADRKIVAAGFQATSTQKGVEFVLARYLAR